MTSRNTSKNKMPIGVVGAGSFGMAVANLLAEKNRVLLFARSADTVKEIQKGGVFKGHKIHANIEATGDLEQVVSSCQVIFPVLPSSAFREVMRKMAPFLYPYHIMIHATKGLDLDLQSGKSLEKSKTLSRGQVRTMSEVIRDETAVIRIGCMAGPNLASELGELQPAATVIASHFDEVILLGQRLLRNDRFQVYGNSDLTGIELTGVLKNIIAIAAGALSGLGMGENAKGLLVSRGMVEMIYLGKAMGGNPKAFIGLAGIGDLVATCNSPLSRNFTVGYRLAQGESLDDIIESMEEVAEGINTVKIAKKCADYYKVRAPITESMHRILFEGLSPKEALQYLMRYPLNVDINFL